MNSAIQVQIPVGQIRLFNLGMTTDVEKELWIQNQLYFVRTN